MFNKFWFQKHQKTILFWANTFIGRFILRLNGDRSSVGKNKILYILPNSITWKSGRKKYTTEFRTHNKFSKRIFYALYPLWYLFHTWDMLFANNFQPAWNLGFDTLTSYPNADTETTSVDGEVGHQITQGTAPNNNWSDLRNAAGTDAADAGSTFRAYMYRADNQGSNAFIRLFRGVMLFDTSALAGGTVTAATLSLYGSSKVKDHASDSPTVNIYSSAPASNTSLASGDFDSLGTTAFSDTAIAYASLNTSAYNDWTLNANGIANIVSGVSKFGSREATYDVANTQPNFSTTSESNFYIIGADTAGTTSDPKLVVTYTPAATGGFYFMSL